MAELLRCSFCNRSRKESRALVEAPGVGICYECIRLCEELLRMEERERFAGEIPAAVASPPLACTFCSKPRDLVKKLIAGPKVHICNECVAVCVDTVSKG